MLLTLLFVLNDPDAIAAAQEVAPEYISNDPLLNADQTLGRWGLPAAKLSDEQRDELAALGVQVIEWNNASGIDWKDLVEPAWVDAG